MGEIWHEQAESFEMLPCSEARDPDQGGENTPHSQKEVTS